MSDSLGKLPSMRVEPFQYMRKIAYSFGWDFAPYFVAAGIWKPIGLSSWSTARIAQVRPQVSVEDGAGRVHLDVDLERADSSAPLRLTASVAGAETTIEVGPGETTARLDLEPEDVELWWPRGHGEQPLYDLGLALGGETERLDRWQRRVGFRTIAIDESPDEIGSAYTLVVNGKPIFARGANWGPEDCFPERIDADRYRRRLQQAADANMNYLRINGVGLYETEAFYDAADELGLMIWQDFPLICAAYPEDPVLAEEIEAEARENVVRLMPHPSLLVWNGTGETIWGYYDWGWKEELGDRPWGKKYYFETLPRVVAELDPSRPYSVGSPYSGSFELDPNADERGTAHVWDPWFEKGHDYASFRDHRPRFASEFGWVAPPTWATFTRVLSEESPTPSSPAVLIHNKAEYGNELMGEALERHFGIEAEPASFDDWLFFTQVNQARALAVGIEHFRSTGGICMGTAIWSLNDPWPTTSWSLIDGDGRLKPSWYTVRRAYAERLLTIQPRGAGLAVVAVNDTDEPWAGTVGLELRRFDGSALGAASAELPEVRPRAAAELPIPAELVAPADPTASVLIATAGELRSHWFFGYDKELALPPADFELEISSDGDVHKIVVSARTILRDLTLLADRLGPAASVDEQMVTLLPGEQHTFELRGLTRELESRELVPPVLRCVNDLVFAAGDDVAG
jgi:beta-mannosidase